ncbi:MAG: hypothetical protein ACXVR1_17855 [Solirubrobacteraceae bacterium]
MAAQRFSYEVQRDAWGSGRTDVVLVRRAPSHGLSLRRHAAETPVVLFRRTFRPLLELKELERYAAELERVARHANEGTLGCFVDTRAHEGVVEVALYDRWFDGDRLRCDELTRRRYDAADEAALVASAEFVAELEDWAQRRNDERARSEADARAETEAAQQQVRDRAAAADELAGILRGHAGGEASAGEI